MAKIPIKVYEEVKYANDLYELDLYLWRPDSDYTLDWVDSNGINTPYVVTVVNNG